MANTKGVADHKAANTTTIPGLTVERTKSIVLLLVQLFSVVQTGLSIAGISQLVLLQCLFDRFGSVFPQCGLMVFPGVVIVSR